MGTIVKNDIDAIAAIWALVNESTCRRRSFILFDAIEWHRFHVHSARENLEYGFPPSINNIVGSRSVYVKICVSRQKWTTDGKSIETKTKKKVNKTFNAK